MTRSTTAAVASRRSGIDMPSIFACEVLLAAMTILMSKSFEGYDAYNPRV